MVGRWSEDQEFRFSSRCEDVEDEGNKIHTFAKIKTTANDKLLGMFALVSARRRFGIFVSISIHAFFIFMFKFLLAGGSSDSKSVDKTLKMTNEMSNTVNVTLSDDHGMHLPEQKQIASKYNFARLRP